MVSARMNGHDLYAYLKNAVTRLPTWFPYSQLIPRKWNYL